ncbi:MAG: hypothetical protein WBM07_16145 [Chitinivibrionales bacterium]
MEIKRTISVANLNSKERNSDHTKNMTGDERISLLEELRYDLGKFLNYDYSRRFERSLSVVKRENQ